MSITSTLKSRTTIAAAAAIVVAGAAAFSWTHEARAVANAAIGRAATQTVANAAAPGPVVAPDFTQIVNQSGPAVVNISVSGLTKVADEEPAGMAEIDPRDPMYEFFRRFMAPGGRMGPQPPRVMRGEGSGFVVSPDGLIVTNAHVVKGSSNVTVKLTDRREFQAKVLGSDAKTDVAVLKIDARALPTVRIGSARDLQVGQWVLAIGSPFGFESTVTAGVVSAKQRPLPDDSYVPFIQTDVAVNPGNSGGPLFNARGEVVGINSQIYSGTGGYQGLSFAIPVDLAMKIKDQIVATGHATHAKLGVTVQGVTQALAQSFKLDTPQGALVSAVQPDGPGDRAGLKAGDVVLAADGQAIGDSGDLPSIVGQSKPGATMKLEIWRDGRRQELSARLGNANDADREGERAERTAAQGRLGLALRPLQPDERAAAGVSGGLLVNDANGPAAIAGIQPGDVLLAVDGKPVANVEQVRQAVSGDRKAAALLIQRDGDRLFVPVPLG
jgi:serine protease Do